jgi:hypothetical protein
VVVDTALCTFGKSQPCRGPILYGQHTCSNCDPEPHASKLENGPVTVIAFTVKGKDVLGTACFRTHVLQVRGHKQFELTDSIPVKTELFSFVEDIVSYVVWHHKTCHPACVNFKHSAQPTK